MAGKPIREVFHISMDGSTFTGVRFDDPHFELRGVETRAFAGSSQRILSVMPKALKAGTKGATVTVVGTGLSKEVSLGDGVTVKKVVSASPTKVVVTVDISDKAAAGYRNANAGSATRTAAPASKGNLIMTLAPGFSNNKRRKWRGFAGFDEGNLIALPFRDLLLDAKCLFVAARIV